MLDLKDELDYYKQQLKNEYNFNDWIEGFEEIQKKNIKSNIKYFRGKIRTIKRLLHLKQRSLK